VTVIATVGAKGSGFIEEVKRRDDVELFEISRSNRDELPTQILERI
jgi:nucleoside-triphosphatase